MRYRPRRQTKAQIEKRKHDNQWRLELDRQTRDLKFREEKHWLYQITKPQEQKTMATEQQEVIKTENESPTTEDSLALARGSETVSQLATLGTEGKAIIEARRSIVDAAVRASISLTYPEDWVLFRDSKTDRVTAYLQDSGCARVNKIWGIQVTPKHWNRTEANGDFSWSVIGDAYCKLTDTYLNDEEGLRCSTEQFVKQVSEPLLREIRVKQAARANLNGSCVRRLTGMQSIPISMLDEVWRGSGKTTAKCIPGRGYGSRAEREGAKVQQSADTPAGEEPTCELCGGKMHFRAAGKTSQGKDYTAFWFCPEGGEGKRHEKSTIGHEAWLRSRKSENREPGQD